MLLLSCFTFSSVSRCSSLVRASLDAVESLCLTCHPAPTASCLLCSLPCSLVQLTALCLHLCLSMHEGHVRPFKPPPASTKETRRSHCLLVRVQRLCSRKSHLHSMDGPFRMVSKWLCSTTINHFVSQQLSISCFHILRLQIRQRTSPAYAQGAEARNT